MKQFTDRQGLDILGISDPVRSLVEHLLAVELSICKSDILNPDDGAVYLVEDSDGDNSIIQAIGSPVRAGLFEGVKYHSTSRCFVCHFLPNNQCCVTVVIPDRKWLCREWRNVLEQEVQHDRQIL